MVYARTLGENANTPAILETLVHMVVHLALVDVRQLFEVEARLALCKQLLLLLTDARCTFAAITPKFFLQAHLGVRYDLCDFRHGPVDRLREHDLHFGRELALELRAVADNETRVVLGERDAPYAGFCVVRRAYDGDWAE